jgi:hypothetical protein
MVLRRPVHIYAAIIRIYRYPLGRKKSLQQDDVRSKNVPKAFEGPWKRHYRRHSYVAKSRSAKDDGKTNNICRIVGPIDILELIRDTIRSRMVKRP